MEVMYSSGTSVDFQRTMWRYSPEDKFFGDEKYLQNIVPEI
jgi:hypothetical protein